MDPSLNIIKPPTLDPAWLAHEQAAGLLLPKQVITDPLKRQENYSTACKALNTALLTGRDSYLNHGFSIRDIFIPHPFIGGTTYEIPIRKYTPPTPITTMAAREDGKTQEPAIKIKPEDMKRPIVIYYHGGGLQVGDLDSEDLTCRRICLQLCITVMSIGYRLMPQFTADDSLADALCALTHIIESHKDSEIILMGSSSGGQLAAQVSQIYSSIVEGQAGGRVKGVLLRGPVTCDATNNGTTIPEAYKKRHHSMNPEFYTSLLLSAALTSENRTKKKLPLEVEDLTRLPKHWIQVCTNDIYYSDGVCYAEELKRQSVEVSLDVVVGYPHTFWLKAPFLERAVKAEVDMIEGLRWLLE